jgi:hypothetical protein
MNEVRFAQEARTRYAKANAAALRWMLDRPVLQGGFLNTKMNSISQLEYSGVDGLRGPDYTYGWIQGRGLEVLATQAQFFEQTDPSLSAALDRAARPLYSLLSDLQKADGHVYFLYDGAMRPVYGDTPDTLRDQSREPDIYTPTDVFVAKGLICAAHRYCPQNLPAHLNYLDRIVEAVEGDRYQLDERTRLGRDAIRRQPSDFGSRMIMIAAAGLLQRLQVPHDISFGPRFVEHTLSQHLDTEKFLLRNVPGGTETNVGHAIEFAGFALDLDVISRDPGTVSLMEGLLLASFRAGFSGPGLTLNVSLADGRHLSEKRPWWSLPETIKTAAVTYARTSNPDVLEVWYTADNAFFSHYWRGAFAYQTLAEAGPVDFVPATPDLDPGYHTGLSLLAALSTVAEPSTAE